MAGRESEMRIVLVGKTGNGKSATGNSILGFEAFHSRMSSKSVIETCQIGEGSWKGRKIMVVDTPGFLDTKVDQYKTTQEVSRGLNLCTPGPHVILQVMRPGRFSKEEEKVAKLINEVCSLKVKNYMIILFTRKEDLEGMSLEEFLSEGIEVLKAQMAQCGNRYLAFNNKANGKEREDQLTELMTMIDKLVEKNGSAPYYTKDMLKEDKKEYQEKKNLSRCSIA